MLTALKEELKRLAADPNDEFHNKVKKILGKRATVILEERLKQVILLMPNLVGRIRVQWEQNNADPEVKKLGGFLFAYLYSPRDFLSEEKHGLFGYLDDACLVVNVYERVLQGNVNASEEDLEYLAVIARTRRYVKAVIPEVSEKIEAMVEAAVTGDGYGKFAASFEGAA